MSVLPHGAEPVTRQADLLLILHALVTNQDFVAEAGWVSRTERSAHPPTPPPFSFFFIPCPSASRPVIVSRFYLQCSSGPPRPSFVPPLTIPYMQSGGKGPSVVELWGGCWWRNFWGKLICKCLQNNLFKLYMIVFFLAVQVGWLLLFGFFSCVGQKPLDDD